MLYTIIALQLADERAREADKLRLARLARSTAVGSPSGRSTGPGRGIRAIVARPVRAIGSAAGAVADAACTAASRIEGVAG